MQYLRLELPDDTYRKLLLWAVREGKKAHLLVEQEVIRLVDTMSNGDNEPLSRAS